MSTKETRKNIIQAGRKAVDELIKVAEEQIITDSSDDLAADRLKKTRDIVKAIRKKIRDEITHHIQKHLGTEQEASTTHAAEATIGNIGTTVNDHHGTTVTTVNDHSPKAKDDAWVRYMERKRLEGKKAWSKERWSKNYDQLEKARAKRLEAMSA